MLHNIPAIIWPNVEIFYILLSISVKFHSSFYFTILSHLSIRTNWMHQFTSTVTINTLSFYQCVWHDLQGTLSAVTKIFSPWSSSVSLSPTFMGIMFWSIVILSLTILNLLKWKDNFRSDFWCVQINWLWGNGLFVRLCPAYNIWLWFRGFWVQYLARSLCICEQIFLLKPSPLPELNFGNVKNTISLHGWEGMLRFKSLLLTIIPGSPCLLG